jgi:anti-sigma factor RsiW
MHVRPHLCERARVWASLRVDGELSELEAALLGAHLERCAECRSFARGVDTVARGLRRVRLERPAPLAVAVPRRRSTVRMLQFVAATAAVVAAGAAAALSGPSNPAPSAVKPVAMVAAVESPDRLRELRRPALIQQRKPAVQPQTRRLVAEPV